MARHTPSSATSPSPRDRQLTRAMLTLRLGATLFGVLGGVACYIVLDQFTAIGMVPAFVLGLVFALLTRTAAASLARDWLLRSAHRASESDRQRARSTPTNR